MRQIIIDLVGITGLVLIGIGTWLINPSLSFITVGTLLIIAALLMSKGK